MRRSRTNVLRGLVVAASAALVGLLPATHAYAQPSIAEVERQIDQVWEKIEPLIEQYNKVHSQLKANQKRSANLIKKAQPPRLQVDLAMTRVAGMPYMGARRPG